MVQNISIPFAWAKSAQYISFYNHTAKEMYLVGTACIQNGTTAGSGGSAAVATYNTPNTHYTLTMPSATMPAGMIAQEPFLGIETLKPGEAVHVHVTTAPTAAIDAVVKLTIVTGD